MNHVEKADSLILRSKYLAKEFMLSDYALRTISVDDEEAVFPIQESEVESRIRGYVYEGFGVSVDVNNLVITITARDA